MCWLDSCANEPTTICYVGGVQCESFCGSLHFLIGVEVNVVGKHCKLAFDCVHQILHSFGKEFLRHECGTSDGVVYGLYFLRNDLTFMHLC